MAANSWLYTKDKQCHSGALLVCSVLFSWAFSLLFYFPTLDNIQGKSFHDSCNQSNLQVIIELINEGLAYCKNLNCIKMLLIVPQALCHL